MRRRYFVRVLNGFKHYRSGHEVCLEDDEFATVRGRGLVTVLHEERDGEVVQVEGDEGADARSAPPAPQTETFALDVLTDEERELILARRAKPAGDAEVKSEAKAKAKAKGEAPTTPKE